MEVPDQAAAIATSRSSKVPWRGAMATLAAAMFRTREGMLTASVSMAPNGVAPNSMAPNSVAPNAVDYFARMIVVASCTNSGYA